VTFVNYFATEQRESPFNLAVARVLVGLYALWKVDSYVDWEIVRVWPVYLHDEYQFLLLSEDLWYLPVERLLVVITLVAFVIGFRTRITGFVSALLLAHMSAILNMITTGGTSTTFLYPVYVLLLFALFAEEDLLSVDGLRRTGGKSLDQLTDKLDTGTSKTYSMSPLKWLLVVLGIIYAHSGLTKIVDGPLTAWIDPANLARYLALWETISGRELLFVDFITGSLLLATAVAAGTVFLETGFLVAVLLRWSITPFIIGLGAMHTGIALAMTPYFFDMYLIYLLFLPWDRIYARITSSREITVTYDANCYFCVQSMLFVKWLDTGRTIKFVANSRSEENLSSDDAEPSGAIVAVTDGESVEGYQAFRTLFSHFGLLSPLAIGMAIDPVERIGTRIYGRVVSNQ